MPIAPSFHSVYRSLNKPLTIWGAERRLFFLAALMGAATFNFFGKMKWMHLYDAVIATPVAPIEIAIGELLWAMLRGMIYSAAFLAIMVGMHMPSPMSKKPSGTR